MSPAKSAKKDAYLGIDLGGSNILAVAFDKDHKRIAKKKQATKAKDGYSSVIKRILSAIDSISKSLNKDGYRLRSIGLCAPGIIDTRNDSISIAPNLGWKNVKPLSDLKKNHKIKSLLSFRLLNDVNAGLLGELSTIKKPPQHAIGIFCGTGIGGAVYINQKLHTGFRGGAGEIGHMVIKADGHKQENGIRGSLESYIGKWALNEKILAALSRKEKTQLKQLIDYDLKKTPIKSSTLKTALESKDDFTIKLLNDYAKYLGIAISQVSNLLEPEVVFLGGGIIEALGPTIIPKLKTHLEKHCIVHIPKISRVTSGDYAGALGASIYARSFVK